MGGLDCRFEELRMLAWFFKNPSMIGRFGGEFLRALPLAYQPARYLLDLLMDCWEKHKQIPEPGEFEIALSELSVSRGWSAVVQATLVADIREIYQLDVSDLTGERIFRFIRAELARHAGQKMITLSPEELSDQLPHIIRRFERLDQIRQREETRYISLFSKDTVLQAAHVLRQDRQKNAVPTGWKRWDIYLEGGFFPEELVLFVAHTGRGKSLTLLTLARHAVAAGLRVVYFSLDDPESSVVSRVYAAETGLPTWRYEEFSRILTAREEPYHDRFWLVPLPPGRETPYSLALHVENVQERVVERARECGDSTEDGRVDLIVVDYISKLKGQGREQWWLDAIEVSDDLIHHLAKKFRCPVVSAAQAVSGERGEVATVDANKVAFAKALTHACSVMVGICTPNTLWEQGKLDFLVDKARRNVEGYRVPMVFSRENQRLDEDHEREITTRDGKPFLRSQPPMDVVEKMPKIDLGRNGKPQGGSTRETFY
jgi:hypothetical protein